MIKKREKFKEKEFDEEIMEEKNSKAGASTFEKIRFSEPVTIIFGSILAVLSGIICMQIMGKVGVSANTSILGAVFAMLISKIPMTLFGRFKSLERQNYIQTIVSGAGFSAANCAFVAVAILFVMGETKAVLPMALGCIFGTVISVYTVGSLFDSPLFPAREAWAPGVATAEVLEAGDEGGDKAKRVIQGIIVGIVGSIFKLPVGAVGIVFIANIVSMLALGIGLLIRGYCASLTGFDLGATSIPQGFMVGAGLIALLQSIVSIYQSSSKRKKTKADQEACEEGLTVSGGKTKRTLIAALLTHVAGGVFVGIICGIFTGMSPAKMVLWVIWTAFASVASMIIIGKAAMYSGWFPGFAVTTIFMTIGVLMGFSPIAVAVLTGYISSVGPCFADMGYDLKTGWIIRGKGKNAEREVYGRKQQVFIEMLGAFIGIIVVIFFADMTLKDGLIPATSVVFATTAEMGSNLALLKELAIWAVPGAIVQILGRKYMFGVLLATGLLINNPIYGIGVIVAVVFRKIIGDEFMNCRDAGLIAGDGLFSFFSSLVKMFI